VVVLGASNKPDRYSNMAVCMLKEAGFHVIPVHPRLKEVEALTVINDLALIQDEVHTLTLYVGASRSRSLIDEIVALHPGRVIFNPGSECPELEKALRVSGTEIVRGCTLVMLRTGRF